MSPRSRAWALQFLALGILIALAAQLPLSTVVHALEKLGPAVWLVFVLDPLWRLSDTLAFRILTRGRAAFCQLFYLDMVTESFGSLIPAAGLAGEPYRVRKLAPALGVEQASHVMVSLRLAHAAAGALAGGILPLVACWGLGSQAWTGGLLAAGLLSAGAGGVLTWLGLSPRPSRMTAGLLRRFGRHGEAGGPGRRRFALALGFKLFSQALHLSEVWLILTLLGLPAGWLPVVTVGGLIAASASVFFMMPHGLGVNEAGAVLAFDMLGYPEPLGFTLGLVRRGRMVLWALLGVLFYLAGRAWSAARAGFSPVVAESDPAATAPAG